MESGTGMKNQSGLLFLSPLKADRPTMVSGPGRSGTTAMARALAGGGLVRQWADDSRNAEVLAMQQAWEKKDASSLRRLMESLPLRSVTKVPNACVWAVDRRELLNQWDGNWVVTVRDPLCMAAHDGQPAALRLAWRVAAYIQTIAAAQAISQTHGMVLVSYEKLVMEPAAILNPLAEALGLDAFAMLKEINASDGRYFGRFSNGE